VLEAPIPYQTKAPDEISAEQPEPIAQVIQAEPSATAINLDPMPDPVEELPLLAQATIATDVVIPRSGLSDVKSKVMKLRLQADLKLVFADVAKKHGLTLSSLIQLATVGLSQQPEEVVMQAWRDLRKAETGDSGTSPWFPFRHSPRFEAEILRPLADHPILASNRSQAVKASVVWFGSLDSATADQILEDLVIFDSKNGLRLTEVARVKRAT
jgi:antitoxin component of RelBE/YafQ-DinJ toxin-antitoxin module